MKPIIKNADAPRLVKDPALLARIDGGTPGAYKPCNLRDLPCGQNSR